MKVRRGEGTFVRELDSDELERERLLLLTDGAASFIRVATSVGASKDEATRAVLESWKSVAAESAGGVNDGS